jgi:uncharacterized delta-60 repeat protein
MTNTRRRHVLAEAIEPRLMLSAGSIDPTFGNDGTVLDQETPTGFGLATAYDPTNGDIVEAGIATLDFTSPEPVVLQRYSPTGQLDLSFGGDGTTYDSVISGIPTQVTVQPDGKILVLASDGYGDLGTLERFTAAGSADQTFGFGGFFQTNSATNFIGNTFLLLPNGNIIISATVTTGSASYSALDELNSDGSIDTSFGTNGIATGAPGFVTALALDSNNNIVAIGSTPPNSLGQSSGLIERFTSGGQLDTSFGANGSTIVAALQDFNAVSVESSGEILALGVVSLPSGGALLLDHFTPSGVLDTSFNGSGSVTLPEPYFPSQTSSIFQPDGKLLIGGGVPSTPGATIASLARVNPDGSIDTTFGSGGYAILGPGYSLLPITGGLSLQPDGKIILGGSDVSSPLPQGIDFDPSRLNANGTPDTTFGVNGTAPGRPLFATGDALAELPNDQTLVAGEVIVGGVDGIYIRRYNPDGSLDSTFAPGLGYGGTSGYVFIAVPPQPYYEAPDANQIVLDSSGRMLVGITNYGIVRLMPAGALDTTFGSDGVAAIANFTDFAIGPGGQIVVTSGPLTLESAAQIVTRYSANGAIDTTFGSAGSVTVPTSSGPVAVQPDGKILVGGSMEVDGDGFEGTSTDDLAVTRLNVNGSVDTTFGTDGTSTADYNKFDPGDNLNNEAQTLSLTVLPKGNILAGAEAQQQGAPGGPSALAAAEFLPNGKIDTSFADGGEIGPYFLTPDFFAFTLASVIIQADGSIVFAGGVSNGSYGGDNTSFFLARFTAAGIPDSSFGSDGVVTMQFDGTPQNGYGPFDYILGAAATTDGKIVVVGDAPDPFNSFGLGLALARYDLGLGTVSGTVFNDYNGDGVRQPGEPGVFGQTVYADLGNNGGWAYGDPETTTDSNGDYTLTGLPLGPVIIREILLSSQRQTFPSKGFGEHVTVGLSAVTGVNFGETSTVYISGTVFNDANGNGVQDAGELGIPGVIVYIDAANAGIFKAGDIETTTNSSGVYHFNGLTVGTYIVRQILPSGDKQTFPTLGYGNHVTVAAGQTATGVNFGDQKAAVALGSISGTVFNDANGDGKLDDGETGISGWEVYLDLDNNGKFVSGDPQTATDADGDFAFNDLLPGTYIVRVVAPAGWSQTYPTSNFGQHITLASAQKAKGVLFGEKKIA